MESNHDLSVENSVPSKRFDESSDLQKISGKVMQCIFLMCNLPYLVTYLPVFMYVFVVERS